MTVSRADLRAATGSERLDLADLLDTLEPAEWATRSLCSAWTVHEVLAHLTLSTRMPSLLALTGQLVRARGDINGVFSDLATERAARFAPDELVAQLRETAGSSRRLVGSSPTDPLDDLLVHGQDIVRPLRRTRSAPIELVVSALSRAWTSPMYGARKRFAGLRFVATDASWAGGDGPQEVQGQAVDLLLLAAGRPVDRDALSGPGVDRAAAAMSAG